MTDLKLVVFSDASFGNIDDKVNSSRGYVVFLHSGTKASVLTCASNKIRRVVSSTLENETMACILYRCVRSCAVFEGYPV